MGTPSQNLQFLRWFSLILSNQQTGIDVSKQRVSFQVRASDAETPNTLQVRIYNLSRDTVNSLIQSATYAQLGAGYQYGNQGAIFQGNIVQMRVGAEDNKDSYLDVFAADGDTAYTQAVMNGSFPAGAGDAQQLLAIAKAMGLPSATTNDGVISTGGIVAPRGKVLFGMARTHMRDLADRNNCRWSIQNGVLTLIPNTGYLLGTAVKINSANGMIGVPEQTENGISVKCYLNPLIKIGGLIQLNSADIAQSTRNGPIGFSSYTETYFGATVTKGAGLYRVMVAEHQGDNREGDWISDLTCLAVDPSSAPDESVQG